jgi:hypothetical protein
VTRWAQQARDCLRCNSCDKRGLRGNRIQLRSRPGLTGLKLAGTKLRRHTRSPRRWSARVCERRRHYTADAAQGAHGKRRTGNALAPSDGTNVCRNGTWIAARWSRFFLSGQSDREHCCRSVPARTKRQSGLLNPRAIIMRRIRRGARSRRRSHRRTPHATGRMPRVATIRNPQDFPVSPAISPCPVNCSRAAATTGDACYGSPARPH